MLTARERLARRKARPRLVELHRALSRLRSVLTVMNTGAHPDDEQSGLLALFRYGRGMRVVIACSTRGEGGQNSLGPERGRALGVVRTRELEEAAHELDADVAWLGFGPDDPVHDFGFSKNGADTLARWGRDRLIERLVRAYRRDRPDIVIPTFLDVPGQHGHHRAMTEAAEAAIALASDPAAFPEHMAEGLTPWTVAKYYLPAWSGGGGTYDDEVPPPNATTSVVAAGPDAATGAAFAEIGQWSRVYHASQGMGRWSAEPQDRWDLHLKLGKDETENDIAQGLPATVRALADQIDEPAAGALRDADAAIAAAIARFPDERGIIDALAEAARQISAAADGLTDGDKQRHGHRLTRKLAEIDSALVLAAGIDALAWLDPATVPAGGDSTLDVHVTGPANIETGIGLRLPGGVTAGESTFVDGVMQVPLSVDAATAPTSNFAPTWSSLGANGALEVLLSATIGGRNIEVPVPLEEPLQVVPAHSVRIDPEAVLVPLDALPFSAEIAVSVDGPPAPVRFRTAPGITVTPGVGNSRVTVAQDVAPGAHRLNAEIDGKPAYGLHTIAYPHTGRTTYAVPATLDLLALHLALPEDARVGYVGGGADRAGLWLQRMGLDVTELDAAALACDLSRYTTIVVGIFAFGLRPDLAAATERLHRWVETGGHLVTLYHRPSDGWNPDATPPRHLVIGSPSLRWRVTDPAAEVTVLAQGHPILNQPNVIGPEDWSGWDKERGLYFAAEWDPAYVPLLAMNDAGERPLEGALLSARIGAGRHTHTSLVLHHQMDQLVPGAFRLMANLVQPAAY